MPKLPANINGLATSTLPELLKEGNTAHTIEHPEPKETHRGNDSLLLGRQRGSDKIADLLLKQYLCSSASA